VPCLFVASLLTSALGALAFVWGRYLLLLVGGSYTFASLLASASMALRHRCRYVLLLPLMFAVMHISYGLGSLIGFYQYFITVGWKFKQKITA
jgi:hypothetical protein